MEFVDPNIINFIGWNSLDKRIVFAESIKKSHHGHIPVLVGRADTYKTPLINKYKYIVPCNITLGSFIHEIRKNLPSLDPSTGLFLFFSNNTLAPLSTNIQTLYAKHKADDGFLYLMYSCESTFG